MSEVPGRVQFSVPITEAEYAQLIEGSTEFEQSGPEFVRNAVRVYHTLLRECSNGSTISVGESPEAATVFDLDEYRRTE